MGTFTFVHPASMLEWPTLRGRLIVGTPDSFTHTNDAGVCVVGEIVGGSGCRQRGPPARWEGGVTPGMPWFFIVVEGGSRGVGGGGYQLEVNRDFSVGLASLAVGFWGAG